MLLFQVAHVLQKLMFSQFKKMGLWYDIAILLRRLCLLVSWNVYCKNITAVYCAHANFKCGYAGDFGSAVEVLVTAISLIKQSLIASDDRCKILISSLQDTLHGIESKSYGSKLVNAK